MSKNYSSTRGAGFEADLSLRDAVRRRLHFIDFRLTWEGQINRGDLVETFGISIPQASSDLALYQDLGDGNVSYDKSLKAYIAAEQFEPVFGSPDAQDYLSRLRAISYGLSSPSAAWVGRMPMVETVPYPKRAVAPGTLRHVLRAISDKRAIRVRYQSFSRPEPSFRWIAPHALGYDGHRWHARAYCYDREGFVDFALGRVLAVRGDRPTDVEARDDRSWNTEIILLVGVNPELSPGQQKALELDYEMKKGRREIPVRAALVHYMRRWLRLDLDARQARPQQRQIVLLNAEEVEQQMAELRGDDGPGNEA